MKLALILLSLWAFGSLVFVFALAFVARRPLPPLQPTSAEDILAEPDPEDLVATPSGRRAASRREAAPCQGRLVTPAVCDDF